MVQAPNPKSSMVSRLWARKSVVLVLAFTGLLTSNIATLLSADFHDRVYSLLGRALAIVAGSAADRVTRHSKTAEVERAEVEKRKAEARVRKVEGEHMATKADLTKSQQEANHLRSKVHQADVKRKNDGRAAKEVASSAQRRFARTIARNTAALPAESIPFIGIGVAISMTALDVVDACETMKEINGLLVRLGEGELNPDVCGMKVPTADEVLSRMRSDWRGSLQYAAEQAGRIKASVPAVQVRVPTITEAQTVVCPIVSVPGC